MAECYAIDHPALADFASVCFPPKADISCRTHNSPMADEKRWKERLKKVAKQEAIQMDRPA